MRASRIVLNGISIMAVGSAPSRPVCQSARRRKPSRKSTSCEPTPHFRDDCLRSTHDSPSTR